MRTISVTEIEEVLDQPTGELRRRQPVLRIGVFAGPPARWSYLFIVWSAPHILEEKQDGISTRTSDSRWWPFT